MTGVKAPSTAVLGMGRENIMLNYAYPEVLVNTDWIANHT